MKTHTSQFKEDIKTIGKQLDSKITFEIDGVAQTLTSEDLNGVTPTFQGAILKSVMKELDIDSNVDIPIGTEVNYKFGVKLEGNYEYLDYGNYIVYSSEKQEDTSSYKIVCYDKLLYSMKQNEDLGITYPLSIRDYINALCTKIGLEFKNKNDEFANFDRILDKELYVGLDYTYRDILDELAQVTASTICLDNEDKVEIRYINDLSEFNTVSDNDLVINDGISYPIKKIVVDGKCEQNTTTGKNLFDVNQIVIGSVANGKIVTSVPFRFASNYIDVKPNTNYSFHAYDIGNFKGMRIGVHELNNETFIKDNGWREIKNNVYSLKTSSNTNKIIFVGSFSETSENVTTNGTEYTGNLNLEQVKRFLKFEMEQGSNVTGYEPYTGGELSPNPDYPQEIKSISGDVKVNVTGKNLLVYPYFETTKTLAGIAYTDNGNGSIKVNGTCTSNNSLFFFTKNKWNFKDLSLELSPGTYTFKGTEANTNSFRFFYNIYYEDGTYEGIQVYSSSVTKTITRLGKVNGRIEVLANETVDNVTVYPQIEKGTDSTKYEPYHSNSITVDLQGNELCSVADVKDELVIENGNAKIIKKIGKTIYNGSESGWGYQRNWSSIGDNSNAFYIIKPVNMKDNSDICPLISNRFVRAKISDITTKDLVGSIAYSQNVIVRVPKSINSVSDLKGWLSNNNIIVYHLLATPQEIDLGQIDKLKTFEGINNITLEANLETNMTLTYANGWETIDESFLKDVNVIFGEKYGPVNSIVLSRSAESDNVYLQNKESIAQNGLCEIKIKDNQIMNWNDRSDYLPDILEKLDGLEYYLNDFSSTGIAYLDLCDRYNIKVFENTYSCIMFNDEMKVTQGLEEDIHTDMPEETETDYTKADKTDRRINNVSLIVDKQGQRIDALAEKVQDISNTVKGSGIITLTDCSKTPLYKLVITGDDSLLFPSSKIYPSSNTFTKNSWLYVNKGESDEEIYDLKIPSLRTLGNVKDEYILENTKATLIKRIGLNDNLEKYVLDEPVEIDMGTLTINLKEGTNTLQMPSFPLFSLEVTYLLKNDYTDTFASTAYVNSEIEVTSDNILLESKSYTDRSTEGDELISRINLDSTGNVKIEASRTVDLTGTDINLTGDNVTINSTNFSVDKDGKITSTAGEIGGFNINDYKLFGSHIKGDCLYTEEDVTKLRNYLSGSGTLTDEEKEFYDVDKNGILNAIDWVMMRNMVINKEKEYSIELNTRYLDSFFNVRDENNNYLARIGNLGAFFEKVRINKEFSFYPDGENFSLYSVVGVNESDLIINLDSQKTLSQVQISSYDGNITKQVIVLDKSGNITCVSLTQTSLKENKKNFEKYSNALKELDKIDIYKYNLKDEEDTDKKHLGFVIGEDFKYSEIVTSNDNQGVDNYSFTSLCFQMIKEQQEIINKLEKRVDDLENKLKSVIMERESDK